MNALFPENVPTDYGVLRWMTTHLLTGDKDYVPGQDGRSTVVDIGCNIGKYTEFLVNSGVFTVGFDAIKGIEDQMQTVSMYGNTRL